MSKQSRKRRFTEQMIERLNPPKDGRLEFADDVVPGLVLRVTSGGTKSFSIIYKVPGEGGVTDGGRLLRGRQHRLTFQTNWPALSLKDARDEARRLLREVTEGRDPIKDYRKQNIIRHTNTFDTVLKHYVDQDLKRNVESWKPVQRVLEMHVRDEREYNDKSIREGWATKPLRDIRRSDVHELLDTLVEKNGVGTAREVRKHLSRFFNWALDREIIIENPLHKLKRGELKQNEEAGRSLTDEELKAIWSAADTLGYPFGRFYQLLILTGQRRNEWADAQRSEINSEKRWLEVPKARHKSGRDHIVPLSDPVWDIVKELPEWKGNDYFLLSSRAGKRPISGFSKAKEQLDRHALAALPKPKGAGVALLQPYRVHDFRVTCETRLANLGFNQEVRDAILGHAKPGLQKTYNKHDYLEEKREAMATYAAHILQVIK